MELLFILTMSGGPRHLRATKCSFFSAEKWPPKPFASVWLHLVSLRRPQNSHSGTTCLFPLVLFPLFISTSFSVLSFRESGCEAATAWLLSAYDTRLLDWQQLRMTGDKQRWERLASYCADFGLVASPAGRYKSDRGSTLISSRG